MRFHSSIALVMVLFAASACTGVVGTADGARGVDNGDTQGQDPSRFSGAGLRRLTADEYAASLRDLLGASNDGSWSVENVGRISGFTSIGATSLAVSSQGVEQFESAAMRVTEALFADPGRRASLIGCTPAAADDPCVTTFLRRFGRRAFRRPLEPDELAQYQGIVRSLAPQSDPFVGLRFAVAALLGSPFFVYRVELGEADPEVATRRRFTRWEMASRLSFLFWNAPPDDTLLDAAERGETLTEEGVRAQVARLVASDRAKEGVRRFFREYLDLDNLTQLTKDPALFPKMSPALGAAMREEIERTTEDLAFVRHGDLGELFKGRQTFVNAPLADLYGLPAPTGTGFVGVTLPEEKGRLGLLGTAGFLALNARGTRTSPTLRGRFIRERLLCRPVPPPPPDAEGKFNETAASPDGAATLRQRLDQHRNNPSCAGCHQQMDPLGYPLERFDALGQQRDKDNGLPIDASGDLDGSPFEGLPQLAERLADNPSVRECVTRHLFRHASGRVETSQDVATLRAISERALRRGNGILDHLTEVVASEAFRFAEGTSSSTSATGGTQ